MKITQKDSERRDHHNNDESGNWILASANDHKDCPFPEARGYDHQDQGVMVTTRIFLVDEDGAAKTGKLRLWISLFGNCRETTPGLRGAGGHVLDLHDGQFHDRPRFTCGVWGLRSLVFKIQHDNLYPKCPKSASGLKARIHSSHVVKRI